MAGNTFGHYFRVTTFGESHGRGIGVVIDGCPPGLALNLEQIQADLHRRRPGQSRIVTQRKEGDGFELLSGLFEGKTTGMPITLFIPNADAKSRDYQHIKEQYRPSHADFTYDKKYGHRDYRGGGRSSARETAARVAAGAVAKQLLGQLGVEIFAYVSQVGELKLEQSYEEVDRAEIERNIVRCPDRALAREMEEYIVQVRKEGDTVGGCVSCVVLNCPVGWGSPVFDKLQADLAKAMLSINACKGFEYGSGFDGIMLRGSEHNDLWFEEEGKYKTRTNHSGGIQGGISNGMPIYFRTAFKPVATLMRNQSSLNRQGAAVVVKGKGRHDPCVVPRAVPIVEAMTALVLVDAYLQHRAQCGGEG